MEGQYKEFKKYIDFNVKKEKLNYIYEVISFLNTNDGKVIIGMDDSGNIVGIAKKEVDSYINTVKNITKDCIEPSVLGEIEINPISIEDKIIVEISIKSGLNKPYYYKNKGMIPEAVYMRIGESKQKVTQSWIDEIIALKSRVKIIDIQSPRKNLTFNTLTRQLMGKNEKFTTQALNSFNLVTATGFNYYAYQVSDQYTEEGSVAIFNNNGELQKYLAVSGANIIEKYENVMSILKAELAFSYIPKDNIKRVDGFKVNLDLLREVVVNAFIHADYIKYNQLPKIKVFPDRIEIMSSGKLNVSIDEFKRNISIPRNEELARVFKELRYMEQYGIGSTVINQHDEVIMEALENTVLFTIMFKDEAKGIDSKDEKVSNTEKGIDSKDEKVSNTEKGIDSKDEKVSNTEKGIDSKDEKVSNTEKIILALSDKQLSAAEISTITKISLRHTKRLLVVLREKEQVEMVGKGKATKYQLIYR